MNFKKVLLFAFLTFIFLNACNTSQKKEDNPTNEEQKALTESLKRIEVGIEGMTCEIGCAKLIQSKLYKTEGVKFAKVSFEDKNGNIEFDENKISTKELTAVIQEIAGGDLYTVSSITIVKDFKENK
ncbi:MAG: heavy-metal-associated domain-containing protein [Bacteroidota bacterium]